MTQQTIPPALDSGVSLDQLFAALPEVVDTALRSAAPEHYTPKRAAQMAVVMAEILRVEYDADRIMAAIRSTATAVMA
ncbi:hypothetical protein ABZX40_17830 [Streptomyces sp. NPDC004610]|uniref:hypothetical protein n=1 Tax=unclassified Streptomyces TaxID=2593676 RepID=UPI0033BADAD3